MRPMFSAFVGVAALLVAIPAAPHHSFAAVFDINRPIELTGTVTRLHWTNPHAWIYIDVEDTSGNVQSWSIELLGINTLLKQGWTPGVLEPGDVVQAEGFGARDGSTSINGSVVTMIETGEKLWVSASQENY